MRRRDFVKCAAGALGASSMVGLGWRSAMAKPITVDALQVPIYTKSRRYAGTPFGEIAYVEAGKAARVALFLHGFPLNGFQWRDVIDRVCMYRRCIAPDFLAMGYTRTRQGQDVNPDSQVAMVVSLLDTLGLPSVDIVASDSGGAIAQLLMVRHPERVRTVLLANCDSEIESPPAAMRGVIELAKRRQYASQWLARWVDDKKLARSAQGLGGMCYSDPTRPSDEAIEMYLAPLVQSVERKALVEDFAVALERNPLKGIEAELNRSEIPTRIMWGTADTIFSAASASYLDRTLGASRGTRRVTGGKLFWPEERPGIVAEEAIALWNVSLLCPDSQC